MDSASSRIPLSMAQKILATFGITRPTRAYERWVKGDGFDLKDFGDVVAESPFIFTIDWRAWLQEELETIARALSLLGVRLEMELEEEGESGIVSCGVRRAEVVYRPNDGDLDHVFRALQSIVPDNLEFRASPDNSGSDTAVYAVLPRDEWAELEREAPHVVRHFFSDFGPSSL
jgi:hypothetical protein